MFPACSSATSSAIPGRSVYSPPNSWEHEGRRDGTRQRFGVSLMCDDLTMTMAELRAKGAEFSGEPTDQGWGVTVGVKVPGAGKIMLYEPAYDPPATSL